jgi:ligand-binding sensor domain-containing protein
MKRRFFVPALFLFGTTQILMAQMLSDRQIHYHPGDWVSFPMTRFITSVALDHETVYYGTTQGILRYQFYESRWDAPLTTSDGLEGQSIQALTYDPNSGYLWAATDKALNYRLPASDQWFQVLTAGQEGKRILDLGVGSRYVWMQNADGFFRSDRTGISFTRASDEEADADRVDWGDRPYHNDPNNPTFYYLDNSFLFFSEGYIQDTRLRRYDLTQILPDDFSNLWLCTWGLGASQVELQTQWLTLMSFGLYMPDVRVMAWDGAGMWIGGVTPENMEGGITWWDMESDAWRYYEAPFIPNLCSHDVQAIAVGDEEVWFGTRLGLARYDKRKDAWKSWNVHSGLWSEEITSLTTDGKTLWIGTSAGINRMALPGQAITQERTKGLIHRHIYFLEMDGEDVWAGTDEGIYHYVSSKQTWEYVPGYEGMIVRDVRALSVADQDIWFGTDDGVASLDRKSGAWTGYPMNLFFQNDVFNTILADEENVWVGTNRGVLKFKRSENRWRRFTVEDGLLDNAVRWILLEGNYVWFGTAQGLTRFYWNAPYRTD